jgi:hypothetical protein
MCFFGVHDFKFEHDIRRRVSVSKILQLERLQFGRDAIKLASSYGLIVKNLLNRFPLFLFGQFWQKSQTVRF